jgi:1-acyl-sn-glycerol-3-phosphate acyltransferase
MRTTIFDTPVFTPMLRAVAVAVLRVRGWRKAGPLPELDNCVVVVAPHTSNWDFPIGLAFAFAYGVKAFWLGKESLFRGPLRAFFRWCGGIPVDRTSRHDTVESMVERFGREHGLWLAIAPEGTRRRVAQWKTGFYYIALGAGVPIALAFIDYRTKTCGIGRVVEPNGDVDADIAEMHSFYGVFAGKRPEGWGQGAPQVDGPPPGAR